MKGAGGELLYNQLELKNLSLAVYVPTFAHSTSLMSTTCTSPYSYVTCHKIASYNISVYIRTCIGHIEISYMYMYSMQDVTYIPGELSKLPGGGGEFGSYINTESCINT